MTDILRGLVTFALCTSVSAESCSSAGCAAPDATSLLQTRTTLTSGGQRRPDLVRGSWGVPSAVAAGIQNKFCTDLDRQLGAEIIFQLHSTSSVAASWQGDWNFMTKDSCKRKEDLQRCMAITQKEHCTYTHYEVTGGCEWFPAQGVCSLGTDHNQMYTNANPQSPYILWVEATLHCEGHWTNHQKCASDPACRITGVICEPSFDAMDRVFCSDGWQYLLTRVAECASITSEHVCHDNACEFANGECSVKQKELFAMGYGPGAGDVEHRIKESLRTKMTCADGEWKEKCLALTQDQFECEKYHGKQKECAANPVCQVSGIAGFCGVSGKRLEDICNM